MKEILVTVLLIVVVVILYNAVVGGDHGQNAALQESGQRMSDAIRGMNP
jgi:hypothetical protein